MTSLSPGSELLQTVGVAMQAEEGKETSRKKQAETYTKTCQEAIHHIQQPRQH